MKRLGDRHRCAARAHIFDLRAYEKSELEPIVKEHPFDYSVQGLSTARTGRTDYNIGTSAPGQGRYSENILFLRCLVQAAYSRALSIPWVHSVLGTFNSKEQIDETLSVLEEAPYSEAELKKVQTCLKERIRGTSLKERIDTGKGLRQRPYILREEAADLMEVYPLSV